MPNWMLSLSAMLLGRTIFSLLMVVNGKIVLTNYLNSKCMQRFSQRLASLSREISLTSLLILIDRKSDFAYVRISFTWIYSQCLLILFSFQKSLCCTGLTKNQATDFCYEMKIEKFHNSSTRVFRFTYLRKFCNFTKRKM